MLCHQQVFKTEHPSHHYLFEKYCTIYITVMSGRDIVNFSLICSKWPLSAWMHILIYLIMESVTSQWTTASLMHVAASKIYWGISSLVSILHSYTMFLWNPTTHGNVVEWDLVTAMSDSVNHHGQSTGHCGFRIRNQHYIFSENVGKCHQH